MAHIAKYKAPSVGHMLAHYRRDRIRAGVAGMRIKVEELRSRISRPLEYLMRREQPRQQSLNDVLRDAQRAADAWNRDHAAPQRTYRGRAR